VTNTEENVKNTLNEKAALREGITPVNGTNANAAIQTWLTADLAQARMNNRHPGTGE
jgi:hypothetical protein